MGLHGMGLHGMGLIFMGSRWSVSDEGGEGAGRKVPGMILDGWLKLILSAALHFSWELLSERGSRTFREPCHAVLLVPDQYVGVDQYSWPQMTMGSLPMWWGISSFW